MDVALSNLTLTLCLTPAEMQRLLAATSVQVRDVPNFPNFEFSLFSFDRWVAPAPRLHTVTASRFGQLFRVMLQCTIQYSTAVLLFCVGQATRRCLSLNRHHLP